MTPSTQDARATGLVELAVRCEQATAADFRLDIAIGIALDRAPDSFTASLDAAMTLIPEGWYWMAGNRDRVTPRAYVENGKPAFEGISSRRNPNRLWFEVTAATPALALTAAALRALAASTKDMNDG